MKVDRELMLKLIMESMAEEDLDDEFSDLEVLMTQADAVGRQDIVDGMNELYDTLMNNPESITQEEIDGFIAATEEALAQETAQGECLSAKEEWARILADEKGDVNQRHWARVGKTTADEVALFGWGAVLKILTKFLGGSLGLMTGNPLVSYLTQEAIDLAWNAAPRIIEDMAFRPEMAWGQENVIEMFPILDKFNVSKEIYNMISPEAIGEISKAYASEIDEIVKQSPDTCVSDLPDINDYFADWLGENPEMQKIMQRKAKPRKYLKSFRLNRESLFDSINEVMEDDDQIYIDKIVAQLADNPDREHIVSTYDLFEQMAMIFHEDTVKNLNLLFLQKTFDLYKSFDGFGNDAQKEELKKINELRDEILAVIGGHAQLPPDDYGEYVKSIVVSSDTPGTALKNINYDFHQAFEVAYGFPPPRSEEFKLWGGGLDPSRKTLSLRTTVDGKEVEFEFWYDMQTDDIPLDPWFRFETMHDQDGYVNFTKGVISVDEGDDYSKRSSKEELPGVLRSAMGIPWDDDVPEWPELPKGQPPADGPEGTDYPVYEGKKKLNKGYLFEMINEVLRENEEEDDDNFQMMSNKLNSFISEDSIENFRSGWNLIEAMSGLLDEDEENKLKDRLFVGLVKHDLIRDNEEFAIEIVDSVSPKEERMEFERMLFRALRNIGQWDLGVENALKDLNIDVESMGWSLILLTGGTIAELEKAKARLMKYGEPEDHFEIDAETGGLLVGIMAKQFASFGKKIEEIFGVTPRGDVEVQGGSLRGITVAAGYPRTVDARIAHNNEMKASILFEWSPLMGYGMEITLHPVNNPHGTLDEYYGVWVSQHEEGPNIGKLEIGIQNTENELDAQSIPGGFTVTEMHEEIYNLTGIDVDEID